jgi:tripartite-type tricarboxylate transporter receptor subunit TctC
MKLPRRKFLHLAAGAAALPAMPRIASALDYPTRPVHLIATFAPGGVNDMSARVIGSYLSAHLGRQFVVDNRPGAGGNVGTEVVTKSAPDGYTLLMADISNAINPALYDNIGFDFIRDTAPIGGVLRAPNVLVVHPSFPIRTVPDLIAYAKSNPGMVRAATAGIGSAPHVFGELFDSEAGIKMVQVHYRGAGPALIDMLGGTTEVMFPNMGSSIAYINAKRLIPLAVTCSTRSDVLPDVPALAEFLPGYEANYWSGIVAPKNTPAQLVNELNRAINSALADPQIIARLRDIGATAIPGRPADFGKFIADETDKWGKVIRAAGIKVE